MLTDVIIREATEEDAKELLEIYGPYVEETAISFEYVPPTVEEFQGRIRNIKKMYPYIVAVKNDTIVGYAYASAFKTRAAYDWSVETTIYVRKGEKRYGVGRKLYEVLEQGLIAQGILNLNACIAYPKQEDEHLTMDSIHFHSRLGYTEVGRFHDSGYKFNQWYDMIWMEKMVGEHIADQPAIKPFAEVKAAVLQ